MNLYIQNREFYQGRDVSADKIRRKKTGHYGKGEGMLTDLLWIESAEKRRDIGEGDANGYVADRIRRKKTGHQGKGMQMDLLRIPQICCG